MSVIDSCLKAEQRSIFYFNITFVVSPHPFLIPLIDVCTLKNMCVVAHVNQSKEELFVWRRVKGRHTTTFSAEILEDEV